MTLDTEVKDTIKRGLIYGTLLSPFTVFSLKMYLELLNNFEDYSIEFKNKNIGDMGDGLLTIGSNTLQTMYENPLLTSYSLSMVPLVTAGVLGGMTYLGIKCEKYLKPASERKL